VNILGYVGTYNEAVDKTLEMLLAQTHPVRDIIILDNASTHPVLPATLPPNVKIVRSPKNVGPNSAVYNGLAYAIENGYEWLWVLESDGAPHPDALEKLVELHHAFDPATRAQIGALGSALVLLPTRELFEGRLLTPGGMRIPKPHPTLPCWETDEILWNGCLFNLAAVQRVGLPRLGEAGYWDDLSQDYGDTEHTWRLRCAGYRLFIHRESLVDQQVGRGITKTILGVRITSSNHPPDRRYLFFRNLVYFWLHIYPRRSWPGLLAWFTWRFSVVNVGILLLEDRPLLKIWSGIRGIWDGARGRIHSIYPSAR
jgi:GT2 family glycosyltransferase